jgi:predicted Na+-dependent transporter
VKSATLFFRAAVTVHVVLLLTQPVLIGLFLSGGDDAKLNAHEIVGSAVGATGLLLVIASIVAWRFAHWPARAVVWCVALLAAEVVQLTMGYDRHLGIHVPLGVLLAVSASFLHAWAYKPQPSRSLDPKQNAVDLGI